jgi:hypothetical protein
LTGFDTIFGVGNISGSPLALAVFMFPVLAIMATLLGFLYDHLHIVAYILGGIGIVMTIVYTLATMVVMNDTTSFFGVTIREARGSLSWGIIVPIGIYAVTILLAVLYRKVADD